MTAVRIMGWLGALMCAVPLVAEVALAGDPALLLAVRSAAIAVTGVVLVVAVGYGSLRHRPVSPPLAMAFVATLFWLGGEATTALAPDGTVLAYAGILVNLCGYGIIAMALVRVGHLYERTSEPDSWADAVVLFLVLGLLAWWLVTVMGIGSGEHSDTATIARWSLTVGDLALFGTYLRLTTVVPLKSRSVRYIGLAAGLLVLGDIVALWGSSGRATSPALAEAMWIASWTYYGLFVLDPSSVVFTADAPGREAEVRSLPIDRRRVVLLGALCTVPGILLVATVLRGDIGTAGTGPIAVAMIAVFVVLLLRLVVAVRRVQATSRELALLADRDELTGLANRRSAARYFANVQRRRDAEGNLQGLSLAIIDLDHFKRFNDTRGHQQGDVLLRGAAREWQRALGHDALLSRHGGEEFLVVAPGRSPAELLAVIDRMQAATPLGQSFSAGITSWVPGEDLETLVTRADGGLYAAKSRGRRHAVVVDPPRRRGGQPGGHFAPIAAARTWLPVVLALLGTAAVGGFFVLDHTARPALYLAALAIAVLGVVLGPLRTIAVRRRFLPWLVALGVIWGVFAFASLVADPVLFPGVKVSTLAAIGLHLVAIPLVLALHAGHASDRTAWIDAAIVVVGILLGLFVLAETPAARARTTAVLGQSWTSAVYAVASAVVVGIVVQAVISRRRPPASLLLLLLAAVAQLLGDIALAVRPWPTFPDAPWAYLQISMLVLLGLATSVRSASRLGRPSTRHEDDVRLGRLRTLVLTAAAIVPGALLLDALLRSGGEASTAVAVAVAYLVLLVLVVVRLAGLLALQARLAASLEKAARTDPLTGLANRRAAGEHLSAVCDPDDLPGIDGPQVGLAMIDLDHFKGYNDRHGHSGGDELLRAAAAAWLGELGPSDELFRFGGEEFLLVSSGRTTAGILALTDELRAATPQAQSFSAGVASWDGIESVDHLIGRADAALYRAKGEGRARSASAEPQRRLAAVPPRPGRDSSTSAS